MYGGLDISVSGMVAQRTRLNTIAANIANSSTTRDAQGNIAPFRRKLAVLMPGNPDALSPGSRSSGVHVKEIAEDNAPPRKLWAPEHPDAQPEGTRDAGYVYLPNVNTTVEQINAVDAQRAYEANAASAEAMKSLVAQALRLLE
ncbi:MAG: flagellar basal body rod protein FlgC [Planctomycetota bacterium]